MLKAGNVGDPTTGNEASAGELGRVSRLPNKLLPVQFRLP